EAKRVRGAQVFLAPVVEHLEDLDGGSLEQTDSDEVVRVGRLERRRRLERTQSGLGAPIGQERLIDPGLEVLSTQIVGLVEALAETHAHGASLDVTVNRPKRPDVRLLGPGEWWSRLRRREARLGFGHDGTTCPHLENGRSGHDSSEKDET